MSDRHSKAAVLISILFGCGTLWRAGLALRHYRISLAVTDDPSIRELEQVSAFFELGLSIVFLGHATAAAYYVRHRVQVNGVVVGVVAVLVGLITAGSFWQLPILTMPGLLPSALVLGGSIAGFYTRAPWVSTYLGAVAGSLFGFYVAAPGFEPYAVLAVVFPAVVFVLVGVGFGKLMRRFFSSSKFT